MAEAAALILSWRQDDRRLGGGFGTQGVYKITGGTGKYEGASGGGTYDLEELTDTLLGGTYKGQL